MRTELAALRSVPAFRRAVALAIAFSGFLAISFLGVRDLEHTAIEDARSALSSGAVAGFVAVVYAAATAGGEVARGGFALALLGGADRRRATADRLGAHAVAGALLGVGAAVMAAVLTFALMGFGGGPLPGAGDVLARGLGTVAYTALMGVLGAALGLALRSPAAAVITALVVLLALDPLFSGFSDRSRVGPGRHGGLAHRQRRRSAARLGRRPGAARLRQRARCARHSADRRGGTCPNLDRHARERRRRHHARGPGADLGHGRGPDPRRRCLRGHAPLLRAAVRARGPFRAARALVCRPAAGGRPRRAARRARGAARAGRAGRGDRPARCSRAAGAGSRSSSRCRGMRRSRG